ncbi:MAG: nitrate reductase molybdenum cofactor assembly chaperone [Roseibium sp.]|uniref:nitrate reductase molybdenum cofactor assembly chaperone n=1 Tax=Roseibium sp. TaxID=1936156 RepID=UPI00260688B1|nr:nitrate reductase molybdenum cofactor assembly chaperone [Roseibium sp.]MCV0425675.1 nitrate reductase molybdenum cofactor assembly chaperone [Roseibium sp.]
MNRIYKVVSLALSYPSAELKAAVPELIAVVNGEKKLGNRARTLLSALLEDLGNRDLYDAQERYVSLFDRSRTLSLHLFEHVHGESRDRGQAMVDLMATYEEGGFEIGARELPDYLPLFLEYLSRRPEKEAAELLGQTAHILAALKERLRKRKSIYKNAFAVLESLALGKPDRTLLKELLDQPEDDPNDLDALDKIWEEEAVTFGGNAGENACGPDRLQRQLRAHSRKPVDPAQQQTH